MPFETPDLSTLNDQAASSIEAELPGSDARLRRSNLGVLARVMAGFTHGLYGYLRRFLEECLPWNKGFLLEMWAGIWRIYRKPAISAEGYVTFTGEIGAVIEAGTVLQAANGQAYETADAAAVTGGTVNVLLLASEPGKTGNLTAGTQLTLLNPVVGVTGTVVVASGGITNGSDIETLEDLYTRYLARVRQPAHGGTLADYKGWALEVPGVTRAWVVPAWSGAGSVLVLFVRDNDVSNFPDSAAIANVQAHIDALRPITADVTVASPVARLVEPTISVTPNTPAVRAAVQANIKDLFLREAGAGDTVLLSHITRDISLAAGVSDHTVITPTSNIVCLPSEMAVLGTITWI
ncbi:baseplate J/gp47 family protein [Janthinobacterium sp. PSPC2-1]|uniref:baseplate J/gp47 family protein n=1 Tax=unclassified Janthinobacterium TaxID=2610881 RepID=UPI003CF72DCD